MSRCLDRKEVQCATWRVHSTGPPWQVMYIEPVCADRKSNCPLDRVLTYENLIYLFNLRFYNIRI